MLAEYTKLIEDGIQEETQPLYEEQDIVCLCKSLYVQVYAQNWC